MLEPLYTSWRMILRAITRPTPHRGEPWDAGRDDRPGHPGSTPLGVDDEAGDGGPAEDRVTPLGR